MNPDTTSASLNAFKGEVFMYEIIISAIVFTARQVKTCDPNYYQWTQWIFSLFFTHWYNKNKALIEGRFVYRLLGYTISTFLFAIGGSIVLKSLSLQLSLNNFKGRNRDPFLTPHICLNSSHSSWLGFSFH